jgi:sugar lactone lactonase YvrE
MTGQRLLQVDKRGVLHLLAGNGEKGHEGDGGPGAFARFNGMHNLAVGTDGTVYLADTWNHRVRTFHAETGHVAAFAGTGTKGFSGDGGPALQAEFGDLYCVARDPAGKNLYIADLDNRRIRKIDLATRIVTTVAGNGMKGVPADGAAATQAPLVDPRAVAVDKAGRIWILERGGHALRVVETDGTIRTVAGTGTAGYSGDGGPAREAQLNGPKFLCVDKAGDLLIADTENHVIRKFFVQSGRIERLCGTGKKGAAGIGGPPLQAELAQPHGVIEAADGTIYIADSSNHRVVRVE